MAARLPQIDPKATIAPISLPNVTVAKDDPVSAVQSQFYSNLTSRIETMRTSVNRMALKQGEAAGLAQGAASATELLEMSRLTGKPITTADLPGDPSSISVIEQAAYKGGLAVVTSQFAVDGRRAITAAALKASQDPNMTPGAFDMILNDIVKERTEALSNISPVEAAKLGATLSIVANSTGVSQARSFFTQQKSLRKAAAIASVSVFQDDIKAIISGYQIRPGEPSLKKVIDGELVQLEHYLINEGVPANTVATKLKAVRAAIVGQKIAIIKNYARDHTYDPIGGIHGVIQQLQGKKGRVADDNIQAVFESLDVVGKNKLIDDLRTEHNAIINLEVARENNIAKVRETVVFELTQVFLRNLEVDRPIAKSALDSIRDIDESAAKTLDTIFNEGPRPDTENSERVRYHMMQMIDKRKSVKDLQNDIIDDDKLSSGEKLDLSTKLLVFQDTKFKKSLRIAKAKIGIDPSYVRDLGKQAAPERRRLLAIYDKLHGNMSERMLDPTFDPIKFIETELPRIEIQETKYIFGQAQKSLREQIKLSGIPEWREYDLETIDGLEALNEAIKGYKSEAPALQRKKGLNVRRLDRAQVKITDAIEALEALATLGGL